MNNVNRRRFLIGSAAATAALTLPAPHARAQKRGGTLRLIPHADLHVFGGASHMVMVDRRESFNGLLAGWCADER